MKVNVNTVMVNYDGKKVETPDQPDGLTLGSVLLQALNTAEQTDLADLKVQRYRASVKIAKAEHEAPHIVELTIEELADAKHRVGRIFAPLIVGQVFELLEKC